jgi:predicted nucleotidyltransferase
MQEAIPSVGGIGQEFTDRLAKKLGSVLVRVILFGSRAEGRGGPRSDYDLLIVLVRKDRRMIDEIYELVTDFLLRYGADISLKIYTVEDFARKMNLLTPFMQRIQERGVTLWTQTAGK